jgi:hypothetical protein
MFASQLVVEAGRGIWSDSSPTVPSLPRAFRLPGSLEMALEAEAEAAAWYHAAVATLAAVAGGAVAASLRPAGEGEEEVVVAAGAAVTRPEEVRGYIVPCHPLSELPKRVAVLEDAQAATRIPVGPV